MHTKGRPLEQILQFFNIVPKEGGVIIPTHLRLILSIFAATKVYALFKKSSKKFAAKMLKT